LFTARNVRVEATTIAADEESPEPTRTEPEISKLASGLLQEVRGEKNLLRTSYTGFNVESNFLGVCHYWSTHIISSFDIALPV